jgi:hypothetical protein
MSVCICCGGGSIISPPKEQVYFQKNHPIKKTNYWCTDCWYYTELVPKEEFETGYNLQKLLKESIINALNTCHNNRDLCKKLGIGERTLYRYLEQYNLHKYNLHKYKRKDYQIN